MRITAAEKEETRERILAAAVQQFRDIGFDAATTRDIARQAKVGIGTLFNYFPTKESIVEHLASEAMTAGDRTFAAEFEKSRDDTPAQATLEEDLFAHVAATLRKLKPHRKYLQGALETSLSPLATNSGAARVAHLETVGSIASRHGCLDALSPMALQLYWTLLAGVLAFWSQDKSPRQEDTLALLDQSLAMFSGWLQQANNSPSETRP
jgi:AcrR family transcriptional regulator